MIAIRKVAGIGAGVSLASDERPMLRTPEGQTTRTLREESQMEDALGSKSRSGGQLAGWDSVYGPVGDDGYPTSVSTLGLSQKNTSERRLQISSRSGCSQSL
jgi:hypothetical protein